MIRRVGKGTPHFNHKQVFERLANFKFKDWSDFKVKRSPDLIEHHPVIEHYD